MKRVEAALAGTEPLLTPPRSTPESPDRSSSPESDTTSMADRDLPLRKRKNYLRDNLDVHLDGNNSGSSTSSSPAPPSASSPPLPIVRMSSVIHFAKAS